MPIRIAGTGCCLLDIIYPEVDFSSAAFRAVRSRREGDGGLFPGRLVFVPDAERFGGKPFPEILRSLVGDAVPAANVGGPSIVSLLHAAQMLEGEGVEVSFHGARGGDEIGLRLGALLDPTPLSLGGYRTGSGRTPSTYVLSDPRWDGNRGERCFINEIGESGRFLPSELGRRFLGADIVAFGGTALVPAVHDSLQELLPAIRARGGLSVVNTVFDFRAERLDPVGPWPFGFRRPGERGAPGPGTSYRNCDLLAMDREEALRLAGARDLDDALAFFIDSGVGAFLVTRGGESVLAWAKEGRFEPLPLTELPVIPSSAIDCSKGDTTGCGDAFAGGVLADLALQMKEGKGGSLELPRAASWGIAAGGFTLSILGGAYFESRRGEKRELVAGLRRLLPAEGGER